MEWQFTPYTIPLAISAAGSVALAIYILKNRHTLGAAVSWGLFRLRLFDVVPIARDTVIEDLIGRPATEVLANVGKLGEAIASGAEVNAEATLGEGQQRQVYELRIAALRDRQRLSGRLVVLHNITRRKHRDCVRWASCPWGSATISTTS